MSSQRRPSSRPRWISWPMNALRRRGPARRSISATRASSSVTCRRMDPRIRRKAHAHPRRAILAAPTGAGPGTLVHPPPLRLAPRALPRRRRGSERAVEVGRQRLRPRSGLTPRNSSSIDARVLVSTSFTPGPSFTSRRNSSGRPAAAFTISGSASTRSCSAPGSSTADDPYPAGVFAPTGVTGVTEFGSNPAGGRSETAPAAPTSQGQVPLPGVVSSQREAMASSIARRSTVQGMERPS